MYLSKVHIDWPHAKNPYELHRALWQLFPGRPDDERGFLFRVEKIEKGQGAVILMQSHEKPEYLAEGVVLKALRDANFRVQQGQRFRFRVRANPTKTIKDITKGTVLKKGKEYIRTVRVPLIKEDQQQLWLKRKLEDSAFIESVAIQSETALYFRKERDKMSGKIQTVLFDGIIVIKDKTAFKKLLESGVGPAKSFGCGMLSLAAVSC